MKLIWTWWAVPGTFVFLTAWTCAVIALRTDPRRVLNRRLSLVLFLEGLFAVGAFGLLFFIDDPGVVTAFAVCGTAALVALPFQYLAFLAVSLDTPLVAPFRSRTAFIVLGLASLGAATFVLLSPERFISEPYTPGWAPWNFQFVGLGQRAAQLHGLTSLFGLIAAVSAYISTRPGSAARNRAMWFTIAFGVRDIYVGSFQLLYPIVRPIPFWGDFIYNPGQALAYLAYVLLLAYGVLRTQLFDIDLKVKFVLRQSTIGALVAGGFLLGSEILESFVPVEGTILGLAVALAIVVALRPVQRFSQHLADRLMHRVQDTPAYLEARKLEVYGAALEGAVEDGVITERERRILARLRDELGIPVEDANAIERDLTRHQETALH